MEQFAAQLRPLVGLAVLGLRVVDKTGLDGKWDFTLSFSATRPSPGSDDVSGELTVFDAVQKDLGLKLKEGKLATQVIVIDHLERNPTDN